MKIIAKTDNGYLINASNDDVKEILTASHGVAPEKIEIGQIISAIDYATTIRKFKALGETYEFKTLYKYLEQFIAITDKLKIAVDNASNTEL